MSPGRANVNEMEQRLFIVKNLHQFHPKIEKCFFIMFFQTFYVKTMHLFLVVVVIFFTTLTVIPHETDAWKNRIVGGKDAPYGTFMFLPYLILQYPKIHESFPVKTFDFETCSSTIISNRHILTAAHCLIDAEMIKKKKAHRKIQKHVNYIIDYRPDKEDIPFKLSKHAMSSRAYIHPSYNPNNFLYDIAIIEFPDTATIDFDVIKLINDYEPKDGDKAVAAGYGFTKPNGDFPDKLQNATVPIFGNFDSCKIRKSHHICTGEEKLRASKGDSGGPLMINQNETFYQIGIASHTADLRGVGRTFYIPLSKHCSWIEKVTKNGVKCIPLPKSTLPKPPPPKEPTTTTRLSSTTTAEDYDDNGAEFVKLNLFMVVFVFFGMIFI